jgi:hypothetical protein
VIILGAHAVAVARRPNRNIGREDGWVENADTYLEQVLLLFHFGIRSSSIMNSSISKTGTSCISTNTCISNNCYYHSIVEPFWHQEFLNNEQFNIKNRYQWYIDPIGVGPIMLNVDIARWKRCSQLVITRKSLKFNPGCGRNLSESRMLHYLGNELTLAQTKVHHVEDNGRET